VLPLIAEDSSPAYWQEAAFNVLSDSIKAPEDKLPMTGVAFEVEQMLSSVYIEPVAFGDTETSKPTYGTRTQSILTLRTERDTGANYTANIISREFDNHNHSH
jgi:uncharacterized protein with NRDE domain